MAAYYNEIDPYAAQWLRNLIAKGLIAPGDVDERSILDVDKYDLQGYTQCHFFAGIGGWSIALRLAGWPDDKAVWTGSCPCQPFSVAGEGRAQADKRHLWPVWFRLIRQVYPPVIFGEQVTGALAKGWLDDVAADLETQNYEVGAAVLPACSVHAPHKRDRVWFVGYSSQSASQWDARGFLGTEEKERYAWELNGYFPKRFEHASSSGAKRYVANTDLPGSQRHGGLQECSCEQSAWASGEAVHPGWESDAGICRLAYGIPNRASKLRSYGNAIVPQVAAEFIKATM